MQFSVLISVTGNLLECNPYDATLSDIIRTLEEFAEKVKGKHKGDEYWPETVDIPGYGDSEYTNGRDISEIWANALNLAKVKGEDGDLERIWERMQERFGNSDAWWATTSTIQVAGILSRPHWEWLADRLGLVAKSTETMGTLGGPLNPIGCVPDIVYDAEDQFLLWSVRVTPMLSIKPREGRWERVKEAILALHGDYTYPRAAAM